MAGHDEVEIGSVGEWVVRDGGQDVPVAIIGKQRGPAGRGYDFVVRRVDAHGQQYGRQLTRGSGALRRPNMPARGFGGQAPKAPKPPVLRPRAEIPLRHSSYDPARTLYDTEPAAPARRAPEPARPAPLKSLRGTQPKPRPMPVSVAPVRAPVRVAVTPPAAPATPASGVQAVIAALRQLPANADDYAIRDTVSSVLASRAVTNFFPWRG